MMRRIFVSLLCLAFFALLPIARGPNARSFTKSGYDNENSKFVLRDEGDAPALSLPKGKGAWLIEISRSGGKQPVKESVHINSAGEIDVLSEQMRAGKTTVKCSRKEKLSARELLKINAAITSSKPSAWQDHYSNPKYPICCDQPTTEVKLQWRN